MIGKKTVEFCYRIPAIWVESIAANEYRAWSPLEGLGSPDDGGVKFL